MHFSVFFCSLPCRSKFHVLFVSNYLNRNLHFQQICIFSVCFSLFAFLGCSPKEVVLTVQPPLAWEALLGQAAFALAALDTLDVPRSVQDFEQEPIDDRLLAAGTLQHPPEFSPPWSTRCVCPRRVSLPVYVRSSESKMHPSWSQRKRITIREVKRSRSDNDPHVAVADPNNKRVSCSGETTPGCEDHRLGIMIRTDGYNQKEGKKEYVPIGGDWEKLNTSWGVENNAPSVLWALFVSLYAASSSVWEKRGNERTS